jgi:hypothetical protein
MIKNISNIKFVLDGYKPINSLIKNKNEFVIVFSRSYSETIIISVNIITSKVKILKDFKEQIWNIINNRYISFDNVVFDSFEYIFIEKESDYYDYPVKQVSEKNFIFYTNLGEDYLEIEIKKNINNQLISIDKCLLIKSKLFNLAPDSRPSIEKYSNNKFFIIVENKFFELDNNTKKITKSFDLNISKKFYIENNTIDYFGEYYHHFISFDNKYLVMVPNVMIENDSFILIYDLNEMKLINKIVEDAKLFKYYDLYGGKVAIYEDNYPKSYITKKNEYLIVNFVNNVFIYDFQTGKRIALYKNMNSISLSPDDKYLCGYDIKDQTFKVFDLSLIDKTEQEFDLSEKTNLLTIENET